MSVIKNAKRLVKGSTYYSAGGIPFIVGNPSKEKLGDYECIFSDIILIRRSTSIRVGTVAHPCDKTTYGIGYVGVGEFTSLNEEEAYHKWQSMFKRCYSDAGNYPSYKNTVVCTDWHNFQNFVWWFKANYKPKSDLDKDFKGVSLMLDIYSPETCTLIPHLLNVALARKPKEPPMTNRGFRSFIRVSGLRITLGVYSIKANAVYINYCAKLGYIETLIRNYGLIKELGEYLPSFCNNYMKECYSDNTK